MMEILVQLAVIGETVNKRQFKVSHPLFLKTQTWTPKTASITNCNRLCLAVATWKISPFKSIEIQVRLGLVQWPIGRRRPEWQHLKMVLALKMPSEKNKRTWHRKFFPNRTTTIICP